jgi:hypothetical protein
LPPSRQAHTLVPRTPGSGVHFDSTSETLLQAARTLLEQNTRTGERGGRGFTYTIPSPDRYRFQWFWDSCFHAVVWARLDAERAAEELRALLVHQTAAGLLPHVIFWDSSLLRRVSWQTLESAGAPWRRPQATAMMQPPVIAQAVEAVVEAGGEAFLEEALPALERYYRFLARDRDPDRDGLISTISQFESGLDYCPAYDPAWRRGPPGARRLALSARLPQLVNRVVDYDLDRVFALNPRLRADLLVNSVYADGLVALAHLAGRCGRAPLESWAQERAGAVREQLLERCYDEHQGLFFDLSGPRVKTILSLMPLLVPGLPAEVAGRLLEHLTDPREFWPAFPVPSVALDEPSFSRDSLVDGRRRIWRGPCSPSTNWLLARALRGLGRHDLADELAERSRRLVEQGGFNEFYDPVGGAPVGAPRFSWATLAAVM